MTPLTQRLRGLDTLRAVAILLVLLHHWMCGYPFVDPMARLGWVGVDLFFVLSGSLIGGQLFKELKQTGRIQLSRFFLKRALRTLPSYFTVIGILYFAQPSGGIIDPLWHYLVFIQNYFPLYSFSASWSLCIEEQFYLVFPLIALVLSQGKRMQKKLFFARNAVILVLFVLAFVFEIVVRTAIWNSSIGPYLTSATSQTGIQNHINLIYFRTHTHLDGILVGVLIAFVQIFCPLTWQRAANWHRLIFWLGLLVVILASSLSIDRYSFAATTYGFLLFALGFGLVTASQYMNPNSSFYFPGAKMIATLSYSIYLVHAAVLPVAVKYISAASLQHPLTWSLILNLSATTLLSTGLYYLIERPSLNFRQRLLRRQRL